MSATILQTEERLPLPLGTRVDGRYELLSVLGVGGFGVVYKAQQETTGQMVALKVLLGGSLNLEGSVEAARFEREMKLIGRIKHPHIVRLIDFGRIKGGLIYMVIEYVEGETLSSLLEREGGLRPREAKRFMGQILYALHAVHEHGVVYRDLKPANIMIAANGPHRDATILDFGISGLTTDRRDQSDFADLTQDGSIRGTPGFMAPELLKQQIATPQSDIYAWGLVFLETLTSRRVMTAESSVEVMARQISKKPVPIPEEILHSPCGPIIQKAVAKDLRKRWQSAGELIEYFEHCDFDPTFQLPWTGSPAMQALKEVASRPSLSTDDLDLDREPLRTDEIDNALLMPLEPVEPVSAEIVPSKRSPVPQILAAVLLIGTLVALGIWTMNSGSKPAPASAIVAETPKEMVIDFKAVPEAAIILLDGVQVGTGAFKTTRPADGKPHTIRVLAPGYEPATIEFVDVPPRGIVQLKPVLAKTPEDPSEPTEEPSIEPIPESLEVKTRPRRKTARKKAVPVAEVTEILPAEPLEETELVEAPTPEPEKPVEKTVETPSKPAQEFAPVGGTTPDPWAEEAKDVTPDPWSK